MTPDNRKEQLRKSAQKSRDKKRLAGFIPWEIWIKPEWKKEILEVIERLKGNAK